MRATWRALQGERNRACLSVAAAAALPDTCLVPAATTCCGPTQCKAGSTIASATTSRTESWWRAAATPKYSTAQSKLRVTGTACTHSVARGFQGASDPRRSWRACKPRIFGFANAALDHFLSCNNYVGIIRGHMGKQ